MDVVRATIYETKVLISSDNDYGRAHNIITSYTRDNGVDEKTTTNHSACNARLLYVSIIIRDNVQKCAHDVLQSMHI